MKINNQETSRVDSAFYFLIDGKGKSVANLSELTISVTGVNGEVLEDTLSMKADLCTAGSSQFSPSGDIDQTTTISVDSFSSTETSSTNSAQEIPTATPTNAPTETPPPEHSTDETVPYAVQNVSFEALTPTAPPTEAPTPAPVQDTPPPTSQETPTIPEYSTNESVPYATPNFSEHSTNESVPFAVQNVSFEATTPTAPPTEAPVQEIPPPTSQETLTPPEHSTNESVLFAVQNDSFEASTPTAPPTEAPTAPPTEAPTPAPVQEIPSTTTIEAPTVPKDSTNEPVSCAVQEAAFEAITPIIEAPTPKTVQQPLTNDPTKPFSDALVPENPTDTFSPVTDAPSATLAIGPSAFTPHISPLKEQSVSLQNRAVSIDHQSLQDQSTGPIKLAVVASTEPTLDAIDQNELEVETDNPSTTLKTQERTSSGPNLITSLPPVNEASVQNQTIASDGPWSTPAVIGVIVAACVVLGVVVAVAIALHKKRKLLEESKFDDRVSEDSLDAYFIDTNTPRSEAFLTHSVV
ncbi:uncharacterized protein PHALS_03303 [Plasmopara halstedii]|uniref:Uncharacterized protein n=1 Tax=Plasmopara halstedii TaxID=4781 RepID=A0A0P1AWD7_PLAHL|nr:uncharacterized protein PHALS_03303 [Plasmopara halstedii]CEG46698.1 hypothetical protein PHALS_03303 [Plasmopara halstedii]|eukprot:XP_024583067.1 hypothetical protein PHALS_03303 [Plasmopara halstedii]